MLPAIHPVQPHCRLHLFSNNYMKIHRAPIRPIGWARTFALSARRNKRVWRSGENYQSFNNSHTLYTFPQESIILFFPIWVQRARKTAATCPGGARFEPRSVSKKPPQIRRKVSHIVPWVGAGPACLLGKDHLNIVFFLLLCFVSWPPPQAPCLGVLLQPPSLESIPGIPACRCSSSFLVPCSLYYAQSPHRVRGDVIWNTINWGC